MTKQKHQPYEAVQLRRRTIMMNNFLGGISWAVGTSIGLSVVVTLLGILLRQIGLVPIVGEFVLSVTDFISQQK